MSLSADPRPPSPPPGRSSWLKHALAEVEHRLNVAADCDAWPETAFLAGERDALAGLVAMSAPTANAEDRFAGASALIEAGLDVVSTAALVLAEGPDEVFDGLRYRITDTVRGVVLNAEAVLLDVCEQHRLTSESVESLRVAVRGLVALTAALASMTSPPAAPPADEVSAVVGRIGPDGRQQLDGGTMNAAVESTVLDEPPELSAGDSLRDRVDSRWFAVEWLTEAGELKSTIASSPEDLGHLIASATYMGATLIRAAAIGSDDLAALVVADRFSNPTDTPDQTPDHPVPVAAPTEWPVTAEQAAAWTVPEWTRFLRDALLTEQEAMRHLSQAVGRTVGVGDIRGHPDRALVVMALATVARSPKAATS